MYIYIYNIDLFGSPAKFLVLDLQCITKYLYIGSTE